MITRRFTMTVVQGLLVLVVGFFGFWHASARAQPPKPDRHKPLSAGHTLVGGLGSSGSEGLGVARSAPVTDLDRDPRPIDGDGVAIVDMGADEFDPLLVEKRAASDAVPPGSLLAYEISLENTGAVGIPSFSLTDTLPILVNYVSDSLMATDGAFGYAGGVITWTGSLEPDDTVTITYETVVTHSVAIGTPIVNSVVLSGGEEINATVYVDFHRLYLPLIRKPRPGIHGQVTLSGAPTSGVSLELRFFDGSSWSTRATAVTDGAGYYTFPNVPGLASGQIYYVRYRNYAGYPGRLWVWATRPLGTYAQGSSVAIGNFDIADIVLTAPAPGATVSLPHTFQWAPRPATLSDTYEFNLYDPWDLDPYFYTAPPLGYVGSYSLSGLPAGFRPGVQYAWELWAYSPDGGYGISYEARLVEFSSTGLSVAPRGQSVPPKATLDLDRHER